MGLEYRARHPPTWTPIIQKISVVDPKATRSTLCRLARGARLFLCCFFGLRTWRWVELKTAMPRGLFKVVSFGCTGPLCDSTGDAASGHNQAVLKVCTAVSHFNPNFSIQQLHHMFFPGLKAQGCRSRTPALVCEISSPFGECQATGYPKGIRWCNVYIYIYIYIYVYYMYI